MPCRRFLIFEHGDLQLPMQVTATTAMTQAQAILLMMLYAMANQARTPELSSFNRWAQADVARPITSWRIPIRKPTEARIVNDAVGSPPHLGLDCASRSPQCVGITPP
jgi:hypothetical protein